VENPLKLIIQCDFLSMTHETNNILSTTGPNLLWLRLVGPVWISPKKNLRIWWKLIFEPLVLEICIVSNATPRRTHLKISPCICTEPNFYFMLQCIIWRQIFKIYAKQDIFLNLISTLTCFLDKGIECVLYVAFVIKNNRP